MTGDLGENRELAVFSLEKAIQDYEARKPPLTPSTKNQPRLIALSTLDLFLI